MAKSSSSSSSDFSVVVLASDLGVDARPFLDYHRPEEEDKWHDCPSYLSDQDFSDLDALHFFRIEPSSDKSGNRIFRIVGKYFPGKSFFTLTLLNLFLLYLFFYLFSAAFNSFCVSLVF